MRALRPLRIAFAFLTRLPLGPDDVRSDELGGAGACFPLVGLCLGALQCALYLICSQRLSPQLTAALVLGAGVAVTGGLHQDGLADWFDAAGARGDRARLLEIMRDPRIGAHGTSALILTLVTKLLAIAALPNETLALGLIGAPATARFWVTVLARRYPNARSDGLGQAFEQQLRQQHVWIAGAFTLAGLAGFGELALVPVALSAVCAWLVASWANRRLGGLTGDVYGAVIELAELCFLLACCA